MNRSRRVAVEPLEGRALLSARRPVAPHAAQVAVGSLSQDLKIVLSTDHQVYHQGQPVVMTLTETNVTTHAVSVALGPSTDGFYVTQDGREVWASNAGPQPMFLLLKTIKPGASLTLSATWDGHGNLGPQGTPTGTLVVHSQIPGAAPVTIQVLGS
jgi:hypothetical protein